MIRSLRARLLVSVLGIAALGLILLAAITYAEQRSFQYDRIDEQLDRAPAAMGRVFNELNIGGHEFRPGGGPEGGRGDGPEQSLPPGTYGELRDKAGNTIGRPVVLGYEQSENHPRPKIPDSVTTGETRTVDGADGGHYRMTASPTPFGDVVIVAIPLSGVEENLDRLLLVEGLVILGVLLVLGFVAWIVVRVGLLPLDRIGHTAGRIAGGDLSHRVDSTDPRTEVGRLGVALNAMLDRLETAFAERQASEDRLRQFLADASHELRTPLSSIRGYAELYRMGATRDAGEVERSMQRIEDEAARMGVLVEDLLTLARLDEVADAPHVDVDVAALAKDTVDDARATAPDRDITLESRGAATVSGDPYQLRQVLANLVRNALVHTPPGTPIAVRAERDDAEVRLEVRDHGPGIPGEDPNVIFERFWRAEGGRERGKDGAGLGLAIVAGIVDAHGGRVAADNGDNGGAVFTVTLPAR